MVLIREREGERRRQTANLKCERIREMEFKGDLKAIFVCVHLAVEPQTTLSTFDSRCRQIIQDWLRFKHTCLLM